MHRFFNSSRWESSIDLIKAAKNGWFNKIIRKIYQFVKIFGKAKSADLMFIRMWQKPIFLFLIMKL